MKSKLKVQENKDWFWKCPRSCILMIPSALKISRSNLKFQNASNTFYLNWQISTRNGKKSSNSKITIVIMNRNMVNRQRKKNPNNPNYYSFGVRNVKYEFKSHIFNMEIWTLLQSLSLGRCRTSRQDLSVCFLIGKMQIKYLTSGSNDQALGWALRLI